MMNKIFGRSAAKVEIAATVNVRRLKTASRFEASQPRCPAQEFLQAHLTRCILALPLICESQMRLCCFTLSGHIRPIRLHEMCGQGEEAPKEGKRYRLPPTILHYEQKCSKS